MDLKAGEISEVFSDPAGAHFIYKMIGKHTPAFDEVKAEIRALISGERFSRGMKSFQGGALFSDAYFNPPGKTAQGETPPGAGTR